MESNPRCPDCRTPGLIPYDDARLIGTVGDREVADWNIQDDLGRELVLTNGTYKCARCGEMSLTFNDENAVLWD
jgi:hypothetical protein